MNYSYGMPYDSIFTSKCIHPLPTISTEGGGIAGFKIGRIVTLELLH
jgi:hypothetical protein